jgi:hypothetical protein
MLVVHAIVPVCDPDAGAVTPNISVRLVAALVESVPVIAAPAVPAIEPVIAEIVLLVADSPSKPARLAPAPIVKEPVVSDDPEPLMKAATSKATLR